MHVHPSFTDTGTQHERNLAHVAQLLEQAANPQAALIDAIVLLGIFTELCETPEPLPIAEFEATVAKHAAILAYAMTCVASGMIAKRLSTDQVADMCHATVLLVGNSLSVVTEYQFTNITNPAKRFLTAVRTFQPREQSHV